MLLDLDQVTFNSPETAISTLLCLLHYYATRDAKLPDNLRLRERIYQHLEILSQREDVPETLRRTCDDLSDAWVLAASRQHMQQQAGLS